VDEFKQNLINVAMMVLAGLQYDGKTSSADFAKDIFLKLTT
jgi:hypothetical protein